MSDLTDSQWQTAHAIARQIVQNDANAGELKKAMAYLRTCANAPDGGTQFFKYLGNLVAGGDRIGHSKRTVDYHRGLNETCVKYLKPLQDTPLVMLEILGWSGRLISYYQASPIGELMNAPMEIEVQSARQEAILKAAEMAGFEVGQVIRASIDKIDGNKVTFLLTGDIRLTQKEPKKAGSLTIGQSVQVEITELKETGVPKKVRLVDAVTQ
jgi:hypothetical protein